MAARGARRGARAGGQRPRHAGRRHRGSGGAARARPTPPNARALRAQGTPLERAASFFVGGAPRLRSEEVVHSPGDRFRLQTAAGGVVHLRLGVVLKDWERHGVATG